MMHRAFYTLFLMLSGCGLLGQGAPIQRNSLTTNTLSPYVLWNPSFTTWTFTSPAGESAAVIILKSNSTVRGSIEAFSGDASLHNVTATAGAFSSSLTLNGANVLTNASGGSGLDTSVTTLGWSGTNLTGFNCATNGATFKVTLTNNAFLGTSTFSNLPDTSTMKQWTLLVQEDSTGGWVLNATNTVVAAADGVFPQVWTNANGITWYYFHTDLTTNNTLAVIANVNVHR